MKTRFGTKEHQMWANPPSLLPKHLQYAATDAYATYETYRRLDVCEGGFFCLWKELVNSRMNSLKRKFTLGSFI
jgi:hypothetical protein